MTWMARMPLLLLALHEYSLGTIGSPDWLKQALDIFGYPIVALFVMIESAGVPFPGETMLLLASFYTAAQEHLVLPWVIVSAAVGAIVGDNIGYLIGRTGGRAFITRFGRFFFVKQEHLDFAERFFVLHGGKTVFFGRFVSILRIWSAFLAGVNHMPWPSFLFYNAAGGILWAIFYGALGYIAGRYLRENFQQVQQMAHLIGWGGAGLVIIIVLVAFVCVRKQIYRRFFHSEKVTPEEKEE